MVKFRLAAAAAIASLSSLPALARDCRPVQAPPGVRVPDQAGCKSGRAARPETKPGARPKAKSEVKAPGVRSGRGPGWIDLGNGTEVRISGSVGVEGRTGGR